MATRIRIFYSACSQDSLPKLALIWEESRRLTLPQPSLMPKAQQVAAVGVVLEKGRRRSSPLDVTSHFMPVFTALKRAQKSTAALLPALWLSCR